MPDPTLPLSHDLPALENLFRALKVAFAHHVEVEDIPEGAPLLRLAGLELLVLSGAGAPQKLFAKVCDRLAEVAAYGIATALIDETAEGTRNRMELISALAVIEASPGVANSQGGTQRAADGDELLTTADVAAQLGMSRPYVSMLCDQGKLGEVTRSEGGHRRIRQSAVNQYTQTHGTHAGGARALAEDIGRHHPLQRATSLEKQKTPAKANKSN